MRRLFILALLVAAVFAYNPEIISDITKENNRLSICDSIVPDEFWIYEDTDKIRLQHSSIGDASWEDGILMKNSKAKHFCPVVSGDCESKTYLECARGSNKGENINYFYCYDLPYRNSVESTLDMQGNIIEDSYIRELDIEVVLAPPTEKIENCVTENIYEWNEDSCCDSSGFCYIGGTNSEGIDCERKLVETLEICTARNSQKYNVISYNCKDNVPKKQNIDKFVESLPDWPLPKY